MSGYSLVLLWRHRNHAGHFVLFAGYTQVLLCFTTELFFLQFTVVQTSVIVILDAVFLRNSISHDCVCLTFGAYLMWRFWYHTCLIGHHLIKS